MIRSSVSSSLLGLKPTSVEVVGQSNALGTVLRLGGAPRGTEVRGVRGGP